VKRYTSEQILWLTENYHRFSYRELYENFNKTFETDKTFRGIRAACKRRDLKPKYQIYGNLPLDTERTMNNNRARDETRIKKAVRNQGGKFEWRLKQNVLWEEYHSRELPEKWLVVFLNGDRTDFSKENLYAVSRRVHTMMAGGGWYSEDPAETLARIQSCENKLMQ